MIYGRLIHLSGIDADADTVWDWLGRPILDVKVDAVAADEEKQRVLLISSPWLGTKRHQWALSTLRI